MVEKKNGEKKKGLGAGAIAGITAGAIVVLGGLAALAHFVVVPAVKSGDFDISKFGVFALFNKSPELKDGKYCKVTGQYKSASGYFVFNDYTCITVENDDEAKKTHITVTVRPASLRFKRTSTAMYELDYGEPIELKNSDDEVIGKIEQVDDTTIRATDYTEDNETVELSTEVEEDLSNQYKYPGSRH